MIAPTDDTPARELTELELIERARARAEAVYLACAPRLVVVRSAPRLEVRARPSSR